MKHQFIDSGDMKNLLIGRDCTPAEEKEIVAQYIQQRLAAGVEADYQDLETMLANGVPAAVVLQALTKDLPLSK